MSDPADYIVQPIEYEVFSSCSSIDIGELILLQQDPKINALLHQLIKYAPRTYGHTLGVFSHVLSFWKYCTIEFSINGKEKYLRRGLALAALLHDIGKLPNFKIFESGEYFTPEDKRREIIRLHPTNSYIQIGDLSYFPTDLSPENNEWELILETARLAVLMHHVCYNFNDSFSYPNYDNLNFLFQKLENDSSPYIILSKVNKPIEALRAFKSFNSLDLDNSKVMQENLLAIYLAILRFADLIDAATDPTRRYKKPISADEIIMQVREGSGTSYDPSMTAILENYLVKLEKEDYFERRYINHNS